MRTIKQLARSGRVYIDGDRSANISTQHYTPYARRIQSRKMRFDTRAFQIYTKDEDQDDLNLEVGIDKRKWRAHDHCLFDDLKDANEGYGY